MTDDEALEMETRFWTGGEAYYRNMLDSECVMAFPPPAGIMSGAKILEALSKAPHWSDVMLSDESVKRPSEDVLILAYKARGTRAGEPPYTAYCTSTYVHEQDRWLLVQHQQTPV